MPAAGWIHVAIAAVVAAAFGARWAAYTPESASAAAVAIAGGAGLYAVVWGVASRPGWWRAVAAGVALAGASAAVVFVTQYQPPPDAPKVEWADALGRALSTPFPRVVPWAPFPNSLATLLDGLVLLAAGVALGRGGRVTRALAAAAAAAMVVALVVSASRGAWLVVAAGAVLMAAAPALPWPRGARLVAGGAALALVAAAVYAAAAPGDPWWLQWAALSGRGDRVDVYRQSLTLIRDAPFTGIGAGDQFAMALSRYALLIQVPYLTYAHNLWLDLWLEQGLAGVAAWTLLAAALAVGAAAGERARLGTGFRATWAGLAAVALHGLSDARPSMDAWTWWPCFALAGLAAARLSRGRVRLAGGASVMPAVAVVVVLTAAVAGRGPAAAAWAANQGAVLEARADLAPGLDEAMRAGLREGARARYAAALAAWPEEPTALRRLGMMEVADGRIAAALPRLARAWTLDPTSLAARKAYGLALVWAGQVGDAAALLRPLPGIDAELVTWGSWRESRGEDELAGHAREVARLVAGGAAATWRD